MVHSGFSSPMKTSALPLPASTTAPPPVPPPADTTEQALTQTPIKPTPNLDSTNVSTPTHADAETPARNDSHLKPDLSFSQTSTPVQPVINGRTSGRKRTPKSCDCCGPNSKGHDVHTPSRGRGRGRGRARGREGSTNLEDTPKRKVGGLLTQIKTFDVTNDNLDEAREAIMGADNSLLNSVQLHTPKQDGLLLNCISTNIKDTQSEQTLIGKVVNDVEMNVLEKAGTVATVVKSIQVTGPTAVSEIKRKIEDNILSPVANAQASSVANKLAKIEDKKQTDLNSLSENGDLTTTNGHENSKKDETNLSQVENGPLLTGTKPEDTSADDLILIDHTCNKTDSIASCLSNGSTTIQTENTSMEMDILQPSHGPILVSVEEHPCALRDHRLYCRPNTWEQHLDDKTQIKEEADEECLELLIDMVHEFLESFYMKYGSFIPLSDSDVVEHLKKGGQSDLSGKGLNIQKEVSRYRTGLASAPVAGFMVTHNRHMLSLEDLGTLEDQNWINDQIINMYGELIMEATEQKVHFFNSFFHKQLVAKGYEGVKRWTKKIDLFSKWLVLIPIHLEIHWSLVTVSMANKTINYYDSQGIVFRHTTENIMKYLQSEAKEKKQAAFQKGWKITIIKGIPQQKNDSDCGVFVLEYCRCLSVKQPLRFSQEDMPRIRKRIYKELCDCHLDV